MVLRSVVGWTLAAALLVPTWGAAQEQQESPPAEPAAEEQEEKEEQEAKLEEEITVTGTRVEGRTVTDTPAPVRLHRRRGDSEYRLHRDRQDPADARTVGELLDHLHQRRHRRHPPGDAARPRPGPDAAPGQRQAAPPAVARALPADGRARVGGLRPQRHPRLGHRPHRGAARRRRRAVRLGRDRRRGQRHPQERHRRHRRLARHRPVLRGRRQQSSVAR